MKYKTHTLRMVRYISVMTVVLLLSLVMSMASARPTYAAGKKTKLSEKKLILVQYDQKKLKLKNAIGKIK